jgi:tetratricopeptide (TPR) repeat protein
MSRSIIRGGLWAALTAILVAGNAALGAMIPGYPDDIMSFDAREVALLPEYCKYTQTYREHVPGGRDPARIAHWYEVMGPPFHTMHHYCNGLIRTNRAMLLARTRQVRKYYLESSIGEFDYVLQRAPADFVMLPEIYTKKGENLLRLGMIGEGLNALERAIELKPDYWPPYAVLGDHFKQTGERAEALEWIKKGLAASPGSEPLQRRLAELGGAAAKRQR